MEKFTSKGFKILMIVVVIGIGLIIYSLSAGSPIFEELFGAVSSPLLTVGTNATEDTKEFINLDGMTKEELKGLYTELSEENRKLREQLVDYYDIKEKNESYENILSVKDAMPDLQLTAASVVGRDPGDIFFDFTIDCGRLSGVSVGDAVITEMGIVGVVEKVYATSSRVRSILSEKTQIGAVAKECGESGVISSDIQFANAGKVRLDYLSRDTQIQPGTIITTSGTGGMFPCDFLIGCVESVEHSSVDSSFYAIVVPYVDVKTVSDVFVITDFDGKGDVTANLPKTDAAQETEDPAATAQKGKA